MILMLKAVSMHIEITCGPQAFTRASVRALLPNTSAKYEATKHAFVIERHKVCITQLLYCLSAPIMQFTNKNR